MRVPWSFQRRNRNQLLTLMPPAREQVDIRLARNLQRNACSSSEGDSLFTDGTGMQSRFGAGGMKQRESIELFQYWDRLGDERPAPRRTDIEPADIKTLLADTFILEKNSRGEAVFRLAGTRLCAVFGRELKGFALPSLWAFKDQRLIARLAHSAFHSKAVVVIAFEGRSRNGRTNPFELLLLPLDAGEEAPRTLGIASAVEKPYWLGADPVVECRIDTIRVVDPDREPMFLKNRPAVAVPAMAPSADEVAGAGQGGHGRRIRHLVVFEGGRET
jgi:hypothetical protein